MKIVRRQHRVWRERPRQAYTDMIIMSARDLAERLNCSPDSASRALRELDDAGLVRPMEVGTLKGRRASTYRLTFYLCNKTMELPTTHWPERRFHCPTHRTQTAVASDASDTKPPHCPTHRTQKPNSSMNGVSHCPTHRTHIDIYQRGDTGNAVPDETQRQARRRAGIEASVLKQWTKPVILADEAEVMPLHQEAR